MGVFGTRLECIKLAPVIAALRSRPHDFVTIVSSSGQHRHMLDQPLAVFALTVDRDVAVMQAEQSLADLAIALTASLAELSQRRPDFVVVQGDTTTAFIAASDSYYDRISIGHLESGLCSGDQFNPCRGRPLAYALAGYCSRHVAPAGERDSQSGRHSARKWSDRPRTFDASHAFPIHFNRGIWAMAASMLQGIPNMSLLAPVGYLENLYMMSRARLVLTDSGGIQEETPNLGVPVLVLRSKTERPEAIEAGLAELVGADEDWIVSRATDYLSRPAIKPKRASINPFGDGKASQRIADILARLQ